MAVFNIYLSAFKDQSWFNPQLICCFSGQSSYMEENGRQVQRGEEHL